MVKSILTWPNWLLVAIKLYTVACIVYATTKWSRWCVDRIEHGRRSEWTKQS